MGLEQVTIDTLLPELVPPPRRGRVFAFNQGIEFAVVPVVALLGWLLVPLHPLGLDGWRWVALIGASGALAGLVVPAGGAGKPALAGAAWPQASKPKRSCAIGSTGRASDIGRPLPPPVPANERLRKKAASANCSSRLISSAQW